MWLLQNLSFFFRNWGGKELRGESPGLSPAAPLAALRGARPHLELVELEQVTVTAASEGGQQTALLRTPLRARPSGGMRLRRDAHALPRTTATGQEGWLAHGRGELAHSPWSWVPMSLSHPWRHPPPSSGPCLPNFPASLLWACLCLSHPYLSPLLFPAPSCQNLNVLNVLQAKQTAHLSLHTCRLSRLSRKIWKCLHFQEGRWWVSIHPDPRGSHLGELILAVTLS